MTVETSIFAALQSLVGGRVFPDVAPMETARPYITYQQVGGEETVFLDNTLPSKQQGNFQINLWAATRTAVAALALQVDSALRTSTAFQAYALNAPIAHYDPDMLVYGSIQDFSIWSDR